MSVKGFEISCDRRKRNLALQKTRYPNKINTRVCTPSTDFALIDVLSKDIGYPTEKKNAYSSHFTPIKNLNHRNSIYWLIFVLLKDAWMRLNKLDYFLKNGQFKYQFSDARGIIAYFFYVSLVNSISMFDFSTVVKKAVPHSK